MAHGISGWPGGGLLGGFPFIPSFVLRILWLGLVHAGLACLERWHAYTPYGSTARLGDDTV